MDVAGSSTFRHAFAALHFPEAMYRQEIWAQKILNLRRDDLARARVLRAPRDQVEVLPTISGEELLPHIRAVGLPFGRTYIDLDYAGLHADLAPEHLREVFKDGYKNCEAAGCLIVQQNESLMGVVFIRVNREIVWPKVAFKIPVNDEQVLDLNKNNDFMIVPLVAVKGTDGALQSMEEAHRDKEVNTWWGLIGIAGIERAIAVLYMIEAANVELVEGAESRQSRRQAERKGDQIALQVTVRPPKRRRQHEEVVHASSEPKKFSHRFEVRGVYHHVTRGPHVANPSHLKPCPVWRQRHDHSELCRREWVPPFVKGPEDAPLIPKRRVIAQS